MLDYLLFSRLVAELKSAAIGNRIRKELQPDPLELALSFGKGSGMLISLKPRLAHFRLDEIPEQKITTPFLLLVKKYLDDRKITSCDLIAGQKIAAIGFGEIYLVVEMPGIRNAAFLVSGEPSGGTAKILGSLSRFETSLEDERVLQSGFAYAPPPLPAPHLFLSPAEALKRAWPAVYSGEEKDWWGLNKLHWRVLRQHAAGEALQLLLEARRAGLSQPFLVYEPGGERVEGISLIPPLRDFKKLEAPSLSQAIGYYFSVESKKASTAELHKRYGSAIRQVLQKKMKKLEALKEDYRAAERADEWKERGDLLLTYASHVEKGGVEFVVPDSGKRLPLDPRLGPVENAQACYKRYKKAKAGQVAIRGEMEKLNREIEELGELETWMLLAENDAHWSWLSSQLEKFHPAVDSRRSGSRRPKKTAAPAHRYLKIEGADGFQIIAGRNAAENVEVLHEAGKEDLWFHAKDIPGGHVVIRAEKKPATDAVIEQAAAIAAYYSKGRSWDKVPVDYTFRKEVRPIPGGKARVTYRNFKTIFVTPAPNAAKGVS